MASLPVTHLPLLDERQINDLITTGMALQPASSRHPVISGKAGELTSIRQGSGMDFDDLRHFQTGDDQKHIDWRASARSQKTLLRTYFAEFDQPVFFVIDRQASMRFGSHKHLKVTQAVRIALWLSGIFLQAGHDIGGMLLGQADNRPESHTHNWFEQRAGYDSLRYFALEACAACPPIEPVLCQWRQVFSTLKQQLPAGSKLYILSDFNSLQTNDINMLRMLGQHFDTKAIRIYDPLEKQVGRLQGLQLYWDKHSFQADKPEQIKLLKQNTVKHESFLADEFKKAGIAYHEVSTTLDDFGQLQLEIFR